MMMMMMMMSKGRYRIVSVTENLPAGAMVRSWMGPELILGGVGEDDEDEDDDEDDDDDDDDEKRETSDCVVTENRQGQRSV